MSNLRSIGFALLCWISISTSTVFAEKYGVVVGVEKYDTSIFHNLRYANEDAAQLAAELEKLDFRVTLMHGDRENARLIPSSPRKILRSIQSTIDACETGDTLLISLSGHGVQFIDEQPLPSGIRETYFCPSDAELSDKESLIPISEIYRRMNASSASRKLLLVDACQEHRLSAAGRAKSAKRLRAASVHENRRSVPGGMSVLFSCKNGQFSWEDDELKHGVFTYHVLRYLRGQAAPYYYEDRRLELNSLVSYVARATNNYVRDRQLCPDGQYPVLRGTASNWSLGHVSTIEDRAYRLVQQYLDAATPQALNAEDPTQSAARSLQIEIGRIAAGLLLLDVSPTIDQIDQLTDQYNKAMDAIQEPKMAEQF
ncbi:MAG: caspase family protein, partial [Planctomycetota bacterium]